MFGWRRFGCVAIAAALSLTGCDDRRSESPASPDLSTQPVLGSGTIHGRVTFIGTPPEMQTIANEPCHDEAGTIKEETIVVKDGGLQNTLVYLVGGPRFSGAGSDAVVLDQASCRYVPHVVGVQVGQTLKIKSSDPTIHNVHYIPDKNPPANFGMTSAGAEKDVTFTKSEIFRVKCDVHPWMTAYIGVFDNPFHAVSAEDGAFEIDQVPAGSYTLVAWHERLGTLEKNIVVEDDRSVDAEFEYKAP